MTTHIEKIRKHGVPEDTVYLKVPKTMYWLKCKKWQNGNWKVDCIDPLSDLEKNVWQSITQSEMEKVYLQLCLLNPIKI